MFLPTSSPSHHPSPLTVLCCIFPTSRPRFMDAFATAILDSHSGLEPFHYFAGCEAVVLRLSLLEFVEGLPPPPPTRVILSSTLESSQFFFRRASLARTAAKSRETTPLFLQLRNFRSSCPPPAPTCVHNTLCSIPVDPSRIVDVIICPPLFDLFFLVIVYDIFGPPTIFSSFRRLCNAPPSAVFQAFLF